MTLAGRTGPRRRERPVRHAAWARDVLVPRGGGELTVQSAGVQDADAVVALHGRCSARTLQLRYAGPAGDADALVPHLLSPHFGQALAVWSGSCRIVALGHLLWDGDEAEVAILVEDSWQRRGVGAGLLRRLVSTAGGLGHACVYAVAQPPGTGMSAAMRSLGLPLEYRREEGAVVITARTAPASAPLRSPDPGWRCAFR